VDYPGISCMCLTFGRVHLLEEAIQSFLLQDYPGEKELLILNDYAPQTLELNHPEVTIINVPVRFSSMGEKRNAAAALSRHDFLAVWDDDDIFLPHRLRYSMEKYDPEKRFFKPVHGFQLNDGQVSGPHRHVNHSGAMWHRSLFDQLRGYAHMGRGQDKEIENRFKRAIGENTWFWDIKPEEIYYLYRWRGTQSYHNSGYEAGSERDAVLDYLNRKLERGAIPTGAVRLEPNWKVDYLQLVADHVATLAAQSA
jgi:glycosyltransferase involved in cell wall biosynthesis